MAQNLWVKIKILNPGSRDISKKLIYHMIQDLGFSSWPTSSGPITNCNFAKWQLSFFKIACLMSFPSFFGVFSSCIIFSLELLPQNRCIANPTLVKFTGLGYPCKPILPFKDYKKSTAFGRFLLNCDFSTCFCWCWACILHKNLTCITQPCIHTYRNRNGLWQPPWYQRLKKSC